ncbi:MAG: sodium/sugar symporter [Rudaea sp.]|uniref:sodium/sugar symporter n=1 Tax=unclassified Rudaea TaxID=2627037 RepID=UPI0010F58084|nr:MULTISPECIES: sodium/sugar symporter [unclassified Rudaea]MBN8885224.1 sodium/sugar symporter [Rudaea sp.]MBR0345455.1 sodium/sugar symporter [Rudaea sp.]
MKLSASDIVIVLVYLVGIFALAQWVSREKRGHEKDSKDYFLASKALPWWAIGTSLIAANISAEQIIGMSGSGYALGLAIASYEWMAALTLLIVGKFFLPVFLRNGIDTMPQFLENRYGKRIRTVMAVFWLILYVFVNLTSILWLGSIAVSQVTGMDQFTALVLLGAFSLAYQLYGGLKAVALTDFVQVGLLVVGGLAITALTLSRLGGDGGLFAGFAQLRAAHPEHFHMILKPDNPFYKDLPGLSVLLGGMWVMNLSYWGFNQYIIQRGLAAKSVEEAQRGVLLAAFLKLLVPLIVVVPGIAAVMIAPGLAKPDQAYPTMMALLPAGALGLVFAALIAAIMASLASKINSIATIFTLDFYTKIAPQTGEAKTVAVGRLAAVGAVVIGVLSAKPLLGSFDQAFQYIQDFTGYFTPGVTVIFLLGLFWKRANENGALAAAIGSVALSIAIKLLLPAMPFMNRVGWVFVLSTVLAVLVSLMTAANATKDTIRTDDISFRTSTTFNVGAAIVVLILIVLYSVFW